MEITKALALGWLIGVLSFPNLLLGQDSKLVDAAKKEGGKVVVYEVDFEVCDPNDRTVALNSRVIHLYDPSCAFPGSARAAA